MEDNIKTDVQIEQIKIEETDSIQVWEPTSTTTASTITIPTITTPTITEPIITEPIRTDFFSNGVSDDLYKV